MAINYVLYFSTFSLHLLPLIGSGPKHVSSLGTAMRESFYSGNGDFLCGLGAGGFSCQKLASGDNLQVSAHAYRVT
jgi:hypothetical protein